MQVKPMAGPHAPVTPQTSNNTDSKARAVRAFEQAASNSHQHPVPNPSQISPEMMTAVKAPTASTEALTEEPMLDAATTTETPTEPQEKPQDPASRQFAQLAKREKQLRMQFQRQEEAFKAREAALAAKEQELGSKYKTDLTGYYSKDQIKQNYLQVLLDSGVPIEQAVQELVNTSNQPRDPRTESTINELRQQIQELKTANEQSKKAQVDAQNQQYQAAVNQIRTDVATLVKTDPSFETIKATGSVADVVELITETFNKDGVLLSIEDAAQQVEDYLMEQALKLTKIEKIQKRQAELSAKSKPLATQKPQSGNMQPQPMKTLTNAVASSRPLTAKERALLAFKGELKS